MEQIKEVSHEGVSRKRLAFSINYHESRVEEVIVSNLVSESNVLAINGRHAGRQAELNMLFFLGCGYLFAISSKRNDDDDDGTRKEEKKTCINISN